MGQFAIEELKERDLNYGVIAVDSWDGDGAIYNKVRIIRKAGKLNKTSKVGINMLNSIIARCSSELATVLEERERSDFAQREKEN